MYLFQYFLRGDTHPTGGTHEIILNGTPVNISYLNRYVYILMAFRKTLNKPIRPSADVISKGEAECKKVTSHKDGLKENLSK